MMSTRKKYEKINSKIHLQNKNKERQIHTKRKQKYISTHSRYLDETETETTSILISFILFGCNIQYHTYQVLECFRWDNDNSFPSPFTLSANDWTEKKIPKSAFLSHKVEKCWTQHKRICLLNFNSPSTENRKWKKINK